jgi:hypothetical protein
VVEMRNFVYRIFEENSHHPDLLVCHEAARFVVHSVFAKAFHKGSTHFLDIAIVQILNLLFVSNSARNFFHFNENRTASLIVFYKVFVQLLEKGNTS